MVNEETITYTLSPSDTDVQGNRLAENDAERCTVCMGPAGDDTRRCERLAYPLHRTHLVAGVYHLPSNTDEINAEIDRHHECATCAACLHDGHECCGCYDGACCKE